MLIDLTEQEIGLLRAGLAAHSIALDDPMVQATLPDEARRQKTACRDLSIRLAEAAQNAQEEA